MLQIISKDGRIVCSTTVPYPDKIIRKMKKAGYKVKELKGDKEIRTERIRKKTKEGEA